MEKETDNFFNDLYSEKMPTDQALSILCNVKANGNGLDRGLYNCVMHTLCDEYRFFKNYPDRELRITGTLGLLLNTISVSYTHLTLPTILLV